MFKFKDGDRNDGARELYEDAIEDFWVSRNVLGKIVCSPFLLFSLFLVTMIVITRK